MIQVRVQHTLKAYEARLSLLPQERMAAAVRSLNRSMTTVRAEAARDMQKELSGLKIGAIKRQIRFTRATRASPTAALTFSAKRFSLFGNWRPRQTKSGVRIARLPWKIETWDGTEVPPQILRHAFIQRPREGGAPSVFVRLGKDRYPIEGLVAPSLSSAFVERAIGRRLAQIARDRFGVVFSQEAAFRAARRAV